MKRLNTTYFEPFKMDGNDEFDPTGCIDCGHGVWAYGAEWDSTNYGSCLAYMFEAPSIHDYGKYTYDKYHATYAYIEGLALELQKDVGGYVIYEEEPEALVFFVLDENAFDDITEYWGWDDEMEKLPQDELRRRAHEFSVKEFDAHKKNLLKLGKESK